MDRSGNFRGAVASELSGKGKSTEELEHSGFILALFRVDLRIGSFQVAVRDYGRGAVAWTRDIDHVQVVLPDDAIQVDPGERLAGVGTPVAQQSILEVLGREAAP